MKHVNYSNIISTALVVLVVSVVCTITSCRPDAACKENLKSGLVCEFREAYIDATSQLRIRETWDSITVIGAGRLDSLYANKKSVQKIQLPLKQNEDSTIYHITYHNVIDTLVIFHTNTEQFVNMECGCAFDHDLLQLRTSRHWIDSVEIIQTTINRLGETNVRLYHSAL